MKIDRSKLTPQQLVDLEKADAARAKLRERESEIRAHMKQERRDKHEEAVMRKVGATPETRSKLRVDAHMVEILLKRDVIDGGQAKDLEAIETAYGLITVGSKVKLSSPVKADRSQEDERDWQIRCVERYREWCLDLIGPKLMSQRVCLFVAIEGMSLSDIDVRIRKREGTAKKLLLDGLLAYQHVKRRIR